jgi:hypothetical protein
MEAGVVNRAQAGTRSVAGVAAFAYVVAASIENMELLETPLLGSPVDDIRAVYVGSAVTYAVALSRACRELRGLVVGAVVLSLSVLVITGALSLASRDSGRRSRTDDLGTYFPSHFMAS